MFNANTLHTYYLRRYLFIQEYPAPLFEQSALIYASVLSLYAGTIPSGVNIAINISLPIVFGSFAPLISKVTVMPKSSSKLTPKYEVRLAL